ncbi:MAG: transcriptional regulator [Ruminococcus flavefaciens]|nr:transcriptional regulator [Ruminococcus flavefaciens]
MIYYRGKVAGGIYDNRFLVKPVEAAKKLMPEASYELPYKGAKEMLLVENLDNRAFLAELLDSMYDELPELKKKKPKK